MNTYTLDEGRIRVGLKQFRDVMYLQLLSPRVSIPEFMRAFGGLEALLIVIGSQIPDPPSMPYVDYIRLTICAADAALNDPKDWPWELFNMLAR